MTSRRGAPCGRQACENSHRHHQPHLPTVNTPTPTPMFPQVTALHHDFAEALHKDGTYPSALSATKPSHILRSSIPTRTSMDDPITLTGTDPVTGWTMLRTIRNNAFIHIHGGLEWITKHAPIPVAGVNLTAARTRGTHPAA